MNSRGVRWCSVLVAVWLGLTLVAPVANSAPPPDVDKLVQQLKSDDAFVRLKAARALGAMGADAEAALPVLQELGDDPDEDVRAVARSAMEKIRAGGSRADAAEVKRLVPQLGDADPLVRLKAAKALGELGPAAKSAAVELTKLLDDPDEDVRLVASRAMKKVGASVEPAKPSAKDVQVRRTLSIFCRGSSDFAGLRSFPSRRMFLVTVCNLAKVPVRVNSLKVSWLDASRSEPVDSESVPGGPDVLLPGGEGSFCFNLETSDSWRKWAVAVEDVSPQTLPADELRELQANERLRQRLTVVMAKPLRDPQIGLHYGDTFTIRNPERQVARGVRLALLGYDPEGQLVRIMVYHVNRAADGDTRLTMNPASFQDMELFQKLAELEHLSDASKDASIVRYEGEILFVGVRK